LKTGPGQRVEIYLTEGGQVPVVGEDGHETSSDREAYSEWGEQLDAHALDTGATKRCSRTPPPNWACRA